MRAVAEALERQVTSRLRECGLVVWLDKDGLYTDFVDDLAARRQQGNFYSDVLAYRGSYLELLLKLDSSADGLDPEPLLLHLPGHTDATVRSTPLLEAYKAGKRFDRALPTLVREVATGQVSPAEIERFLAQSDLTLEAAEEWLQGHLSADRTGWAGILHHRKPEGVLEDLLQGKLDIPEADCPDLEKYLETHTGMDATFTHIWTQRDKNWRTLLDALAAWLMCVEYVGDLTRAPILEALQRLTKLSAPLLKKCDGLLKLLRNRYPERYTQFALQTEAMFTHELEAGSPEDLGRIDTFSREDSRLLEASVAALQAEHYAKALDWSRTRLDSPSVWLKTDPLKRQEWQLVHAFATLGQALATSVRPLKNLNSLAEAIERYTGGVSAVDQAHRHFEQACVRLREPQLRHFAELYAAAASLRALYHRWADDLGKGFADVCLAHGFLPEPGLQQRTLYEQVVHPLTQAGKGTVAYFMVDALRYEMAQELAQRLTRPGARLHLRARLSELPSITSVGMNVLAPVARDGRLTVEGSFKGFRSGEYAVTSRANRLRAMGDRSLETLPGGRRSPLGLTLREVSELQPDELKKKIARTPLVVVHARDIDSAGESDLCVPLFEPLLGDLYSAVNLLRNAGVDEFVVTADHGFLLLDESRESLTFASSSRRYVLTDAASRQDETVTVSTSSLGYDGVPGFLTFPRGAAVFKAKGDVAAGYVHGGNSLQERVIPVLTLSYATREITGLGKYRLEAELKAPVLGFPRLVIRLHADDQMLLNFENKVVPLSIRALDSPTAQVIYRQVNGASQQHQQIHVPVGAEVEVIFSLEGGTAPRTNLEIYHPNGDEKIAPLRLSEFFDVTVPLKTAEPVRASSWEDAIPDELHRRVFVHLSTYGSIDEEELLRIVGTLTASRRFARKYQEYLPLLPFEIDIDASGPLKRYRKK